MISYRSTEFIRGMLGAYERDVGWLSWIMAALVADAGPDSMLHYVTSRSIGAVPGVAVLVVLGAVLLFASRLQNQSARFGIAICGGLVWGIFAEQVTAAGLLWAGALGFFATIRCAQIAIELHRR